MLSCALSLLILTSIFFKVKMPFIFVIHLQSFLKTSIVQTKQIYLYNSIILQWFMKTIDLIPSISSYFPSSSFNYIDSFLAFFVFNLFYICLLLVYNLQDLFVSLGGLFFNSFISSWLFPLSISFFHFCKNF